jgi:uncharacterized protein YbaP (TraB family)
MALTPDSAFPLPETVSMRPMPQKIARHLLLSALVLTPATALPGVYKCLDQNNKVFYQDKPCKELTSAGLSPALAKLAPDENRQHLLWKAVSGDQTFYLLGSLTFGTADMYPLPESVMDAFTGSAVLVVANELDVGESAAKSPAATAKGHYADGSTLQNHVKPATWEKTLELAKTLNITEEALAPQKPWMAALSLKNAALRQAGYDDKLSVDRTFVKAAETLKPIIEIDSVEDQVKLYDELPDAEQEQILLRALNEADPKSDHFKGLIEAWKKGDSNALEITLSRVLDGLPKADKLLEKKASDRNAALADKIAEMVADRRVYFFVVDAKHLPGDKGILELLRGKGFSFSQI